MRNSLVIVLSEWFHSHSLGRRLVATLVKAGIEGAFWYLVGAALVTLAVVIPAPILGDTALLSPVFYQYTSIFGTFMFGTSWCLTTLPASEI